MDDQYRIQAKTDGEWKTQKVFSSRDSYGDVRSGTDNLAASGRFEAVRILEAYTDQESGEKAYRTAFESDFQPTEKPLNETASKNRERPAPEIYKLKRGLTGEWVQLSETQAKQHPLYGVEGWLVPVCFLLFFSPFAVFYHFDDPVGLNLVVIIVFIVMFWLPLALLIIKSRFFQGVTMTLFLVFLVLFAVGFSLSESFQTGDLFEAGKLALLIGYVALSERVNVTFKHRVRRRSLGKIWNEERIKSAKFV